MSLLLFASLFPPFIIVAPSEEILNSRSDGEQLKPDGSASLGTDCVGWGAVGPLGMVRGVVFAVWFCFIGSSFFF